MIFRKITISDRDLFEKYVMGVGEDNCETAFITMLIWQDHYGVTFCADEDTLLIRSYDKSGQVFALPFGNLKKGVERILEFTGGDLPVFRAQQGPRLDRFIRETGARYDVVELDEDADYIYLKEDLANLTGKKYQSKRNHISAFSRHFEWSYEPVCADNIADVIRCADSWYEENIARMTPELSAERAGLYLLLKNFDALGIFGGAIRVGEKIVAFCVASLLNKEVVNVHIEKALADYEGAYAAINNQFAKHLPDEIVSINREDDMGLEGLRKAKLSYHPTRFLEKYLCLPRKPDEVRDVYAEAFGESPLFDGLFFNTYRNSVKTLEVNGKIVSILFLLPCFADNKKYYYLYAAATAASERGKGYMSRLIKEVLASIDAPVFLKPASDELVGFYSKLGFRPTKGVAAGGDVKIVVSDAHKRLAAMCDDNPKTFTLMFSEDTADRSFEFPYIMK